MKQPELAAALFHEAGDALFLIDPARDRVADANPVALRLTSFTRDALLRLPPADLFRFETRGDGSRLRHAFEKTTLFHARDGYLLRTALADEWIPVNLSIARLHVPPVPLILITARDRREQRAALLRLQKAESELRRVLAAVPDGVWSARRRDGRWDYRYLSTAFTHILGRAEAELRAEGWGRFVEHIHSDDRERVEAELRGLPAGLQVDRECEYRIVRLDGSVRWVSDHLRLSRSEDGRPVRVDGVLVDITDRRHAEAALAREHRLLRGLIDSVPDPIRYSDRDGVYLGCNTAYEEYIGRRESEVVGRTRAEVYSPERAAEADAACRQVLQTERAALFERWTAWPDGRAGIFETLLTPLQDASDQTIGVVAISRDVTGRKRLEEQLTQAGRMEAVGQLAGGVAHDFNNLLTAVLGNLALAKQRLPEQHPARDAITASEQAAWRAADLTGQLLSFARGGAVRLEPVDLYRAAEDAVSLLRRTLDPRLQIVIGSSAGLWPVSADPGQVGQLLLNLCLNARDAMPDGGTLTISTANARLDADSAGEYTDGRPGEFVQLQVMDTGHGIPSEVLPHIFEPFFTTKPRGQGTGLGLASVYGIVRQHQGWVTCDSTVGLGTTMTIFLPRASRPVTPAEIVATPDSPLRGNGELILLADDEPLIRNLGQALLEQYGYRVLLAIDGREAVEIHARERGRIQLIVLDLTMPRLSGREALRELLQAEPGLRVLLSSGYSAEQLSSEEMQQVCGFVAKPYRPQDLARAVREALRDRP